MGWNYKQDRWCRQVLGIGSSPSGGVLRRLDGSVRSGGSLWPLVPSFVVEGRSRGCFQGGGLGVERSRCLLQVGPKLG